MRIIILEALQSELLRLFGRQICDDVRVLPQQLAWVSDIKGDVICDVMPLWLKRQIPAKVCGISLLDGPYRNHVYIEPDLCTEYEEVLAVLVHELRHLWQNAVYRGQPQTLYTSLDKKQPYETMVSEIDARQAATCWELGLPQSKTLNVLWPFGKRVFSLEDLRDPLTWIYVSATLFGSWSRP